MKFKMRAREHYEVHNIKGENFETKYKGFNNTVNLWWENPYDLYYGFSFSPIFSGLKNKEDQSLGDEIDYFNIGLELKYFPKDYLPSVLENFYIRPGTGYSVLKPGNNVNDAKGYNLYLGLGYEYPFKHLGLALEVAYRYANLEDGVSVQSFTPSIGFHFYEKF
jgi:hypothetical protein